MIRSSRSDKIFLSINNIVLGIFLITVLYPIWIVLVSSFSDPTYVSAGKVCGRWAFRWMAIARFWITKRLFPALATA